MPNVRAKGKRTLHMWITPEERATLERIVKETGSANTTDFFRRLIIKIENGEIDGRKLFDR